MTILGTGRWVKVGDAEEDGGSGEKAKEEAVMNPTHTSEAPRTRGMKLQMEQPGRSAAPGPAWALLTGAVADLAPAHREAQSS